MLVCCAFFSPHTVLCVPSFQTNQLQFHLSTEYFASSAVEHPGALLRTSNVKKCFFWTAMASSVVSSHEHHSCLVFDIVFFIVDSTTEMLASSRDVFMLLADTLGFFLTSLSILRCALAVIIAGRSLLGRVATVLTFLHLQTICLTVDGLQRNFCNPFQLHARQPFLILGRLRSLLFEAWFTSGNASYEQQTQIL